MKREELMQRIEQHFDAKCDKHPEGVAKLLEDIVVQVDAWAREEERQEASVCTLAALESNAATIEAQRPRIAELEKANYALAQAEAAERRRLDHLEACLKRAEDGERRLFSPTFAVGRSVRAQLDSAMGTPSTQEVANG